jgi:glycosyltransferase involved in cell wall biosynthesis
MAEKDKTKILFVGDLIVPTGFGSVMHNIIKPNTEEFDITGLGVNYKGDPHQLGIPVYPATISGQGNVYGIERMVDMLKGNVFDVLFILNDSWVISYYLGAIKEHLKGVSLPKIVVYFPVDSEYHNPVWYKDFDIVDKAYTYTEFGKRVVNECAPKLEVGVIPHGTNTDDFFQTHDTRLEAKLDFFGEKILESFGKKEESFIVLNANRNQGRKRLDVTIEGFSMFAKGKPEAVRLYMHCGVVDQAIDVAYIATRYGIDNRLILTNLNRGVQRIAMPKLNQIYNACDVGINTSMGEGWGLTNTEHAVTGAVQLVPQHSACEEIFQGCGYLMETGSRYTFDGSQAVGQLVKPEAVAKALQAVYENEELRNGLAKAGQDKFLEPEYQWGYIADQWRDVFIEVTNDGDTVSN